MIVMPNAANTIMSIAKNALQPVRNVQKDAGRWHKYLQRLIQLGKLEFIRADNDFCLPN